MNTKLDFSSLENAVASLHRALEITEANRYTNEDYHEVLQAGVIQNFEFTYELCWKFMKRWLEINLGGVYVDGLSRHELFRLAAEHGLIDKTDQWFKYHEARNETSHTYEKTVAERVFKVAKEFSKDAKQFLNNLKNKDDSSKR